MKKKFYLYKLFNITGNELKTISLFFIYMLCISLFYAIASTVSNGLFLSTFGKEASLHYLPFVYIGTAILSVIFTLLYNFLLAKFPKTKVIFSTQIIFVLILVLLRFLLLIGNISDNVISFLLLVWVEVCFLMGIMLFYSFMGDFFISRDARKLYGYINGGLPAGIFFGGRIAVFLLSVISPENLLFIAGFIFALVSILPLIISSKMKKVISNDHDAVESRIIAEQGRNEDKVPLKSLLQKPFVMLIFVMILTEIIYAIVLNFQIKTVASQMLGKEEIALFFGDFYTYIGIVQFIVQFLLVRFLLNRFGILTSLSILPVMVLIGSICFLFFPTIYVIAALNVIRYGFGGTLNLPARELLYFPLSKRLRQRAQTFGGGALDPIGNAFAGLLLLAFVPFFSKIKYFSFIAIGVSIIGLVIIFLLKPQYKKILEKSIQNWHIDAEKWEKIFTSSGNNSFIRNLLRSTETDTVLLTLNLIEDNSINEYIDIISELALSENEYVSIKAIQLLGKSEDTNNLETLMKIIENNNRTTIRAEAILSYFQIERQDAVDKLRKYMNSDEMEIRIATLSGMSMYAGKENQSFVISYIKALIKEKNPEMQIEALKILSKTGSSRAGLIIQQFLNVKNEAVRKEALKSSIHLEDPSLVPYLVRQLDNKNLREEAIRAIRAMPPDAVPIIKDIINTNNTAKSNKYVLIQALEKIGCNESALVLTDLCRKKDNVFIALTSAKSLAMLIHKKQSVSIDKAIIREQIDKVCSDIETLSEGVQETEHYNKYISLLYYDYMYLLMELLFYYLYITYDDNRIQKVQFQLLGSNATLKSNSIDLLELILTKDDAKKLIPIVSLFIKSVERKEQDKSDISITLIKKLLNIDLWVKNITLYLFTKTENKIDAIKDIIMAEEKNLDLFRIISIMSFLKEIDLFKDIPGSYLASVAEIVKEKTYYKGEKLFSQGDVGDALYLVDTGLIGIKVNDNEVAKLGKNACIGEMALIDGEQRSASAVALEESKLYYISAFEFNYLLSTQPSIAISLLKTLSSRIREINKNR